MCRSGIRCFTRYTGVTATHDKRDEISLVRELVFTVTGKFPISVGCQILLSFERDSVLCTLHGIHTLYGIQLVIDVLRYSDPLYSVDHIRCYTEYCVKRETPNTHRT